MRIRLKWFLLTRLRAEVFFLGKIRLEKDGRHRSDAGIDSPDCWIVEDLKEAGLDQEQWPAEYEAFNQSPSSYYSLILRTSQNPGAVLTALAPMIHGVNPNVSVDWQRTMEDRIDDSEAANIHRSAAYLFGGFAVLALVLGVVGLYGVIAFSVGRRTREIGVRMALGAQRSSVYRLVLKRGGTAHRSGRCARAGGFSGRGDAYAEAAVRGAGVDA